MITISSCRSERDSNAFSFSGGLRAFAFPTPRFPFFKEPIPSKVEISFCKNEQNRERASPISLSFKTSHS